MPAHFPNLLRNHCSKWRGVEAYHEREVLQAFDDLLLYLLLASKNVQFIKGFQEFPRAVSAAVRKAPGSAGMKCAALWWR